MLVLERWKVAQGRLRQGTERRDDGELGRLDVIRRTSRALK